MPLPAGPRPHPILGHLREFRGGRLEFFTRCARTYGDVVPLRLPMGKRILLLSRPDLIEQVLVTQANHFIKHFGLRMYRPVLGNGLVTSEGTFWRRQRKLAAPAFQASQLARYAPDMVSAAERVVEQWRAHVPPQEGQHVRDVHADMMRLTLEIASRTFFGADASPSPEIVGDAMHVSLRAIDARFSRLVPIPDWFPTPANVRLKRSKRVIDDIVAGIVARRRESGATSPAGHDDLLSALLRARDEDDGSGMSDAQLLDEVRTIFLAGHETTALALAYALYLLAANPDAQADLHAELSSTLGGRLPAHEDLPRLRYARNVVMESMRLYPPADVLGREAVTDCMVGEVRVPRGTNVFMSQWVMHRDGRYFRDPEAFDPARWTDEFERTLPRFAYFPFGGGPRYCIGQTFAMSEATLVLATLCQHFQFAPDAAFKLELWPSITLRPRSGVRLLLHERLVSHESQESPRITQTSLN
jgi:cytochrome P450